MMRAAILIIGCVLLGGCIVAINTGPGRQEIKQDAVASRLVHGDGTSNTASNVTSGGGSAVIPLP